MLKLDNHLLDELGLGNLPEDQKRSMLQHIYDTLELRVGTNLANQMTDQQLEEFEKFIDDGGDANQAQALQWLETNLPNYKQVVNEVFEALKTEIKQMASQIVAASAPAGQQQAQVPQQPSPMQGQPPVQPGAPMSPQPQMPPQQPYTAPAPAGYQQPQMPPMPPQPQSPLTPMPDPQQPAQGQQQQGAQVYPFPSQQPPAGPGGYQQPPQYPDGQQAA